MSGHWCIAYLGQPWESKAHDCWGFFRRVQREVFNRDVPAVEVKSYRAAEKAKILETHAHRLAWVEIARPDLQDGDGVRMTSASEPGHVGVWAAVDGGRVVHCDEHLGVQATPLDRIAEEYSRVQFYRFAGETCLA